MFVFVGWLYEPLDDSGISFARCRLVAEVEAAALACVFFFQAEDGIRDKLVTGVQTCALPISVKPRCSTYGTSVGSAWPGAVASVISPGHRRKRSCLMSAARWPGSGVRLHATVKVTGPRSGPTLATTNSGPIRKSGCGREARNTWAGPGAGDATIRKAAISRARRRSTSELVAQDRHRVQ